MSKFTRSELAKRNITMSYNLVAMPALNPIENVFGLLKNFFKRIKLNRI
jgi:hypothetical protein